MKQMLARWWVVLIGCLIGGGGVLGLPREVSAEECRIVPTVFRLMVYTNLGKTDCFPEFSPYSSTPEFTNSYPMKYYRMESIYTTGRVFYTDQYEYRTPDASYSYTNTALSEGVKMMSRTGYLGTVCYTGSITNVTNYNFYFSGTYTNDHTNYAIHTTSHPSFLCDGTVDGPVFADPTVPWQMPMAYGTNWGTQPAHLIFRESSTITNGWYSPWDTTTASWAWTGTNSWVEHWVRHDEYTTDQLRTNCLNELNRLGWPTNSSAWGEGIAAASNLLSSGHDSLVMSRSKYRFRFPTVVGRRYQMFWTIRTTTAGTNGTIAVTQMLTNSPTIHPGTGADVNTEEFILDLPAEGQTVEVVDAYAQVISAACGRLDFDVSSVLLCKGMSLSVAANVYPPGATVNWIYGTPGIATVSGSAPTVIVTASSHLTGVTTIQGVVAFGGFTNISAPLTVTVADVQLTGPVAVGTGRAGTFAATVSPPGLGITFQTEDSSIATGWGTDTSITLTGVAAGQTHLWAFLNGNKLSCFEVGIIVSNVPSVSLSASELTLCVSNTASLIATVTPDTNILTYLCIDTNIATVSVSDGTNLTITGVAPGATMLQAKFGSLVLGSIPIQVVRVDFPAGLLVPPGGGANFVAVVQPPSAASQITYDSDNPAVLTATGSGTAFTVAGVSNGTARVTAALNGVPLCGFTSVTVSNNVPLVTLPALIEVCHLQTRSFPVAVTPTNAAITFEMVTPAVASAGVLGAGVVPVTGGANGGITQIRAMFGSNLLASTEVRCIRVDFPGNDPVLGVGAVGSYFATVTPGVSVGDVTFVTPDTNGVVTSLVGGFSLSGVSAGSVTVQAVVGGTPICDSRTYTITNSPSFAFASNRVYLCQNSALTLGATQLPADLPVVYEIAPSNGIVSTVVGSSNGVVITGGATNGAAVIYARSGATTLGMLEVSVLQISFPTNQMMVYGTLPITFPVDVLPVGDAGAVGFLTTNTDIVTVSGTGTSLQVSGVSNGLATVFAMLGTNPSCGSATVIRTNGMGAYFSSSTLAFCIGTNGFLSCTAAPPGLVLTFELADPNQAALNVAGPTNGVYGVTVTPWYAGTNTIRAMYGTNMLAQANILAVSIDFGTGGLTLLTGTTNQFTPTITPTQAVSMVYFASLSPQIAGVYHDNAGGTTTVTVITSPTNTGVAWLDAYVGSNSACNSLWVGVGNLIVPTNSVMVCPGTTNRVGFILNPTNFPVTWSLATNTAADFWLDDTNLVVVGLAPGTNELTAWFGTNAIARVQITTLGIDFGTNDLIVLAGRTNHFFTLLSPTNAVSTNITYRVDPTNAIAVVSGTNTTFSATGVTNTNGFTVVQAMLGANVLCNAALLTVLEFSVATNTLYVCEDGSASRPVVWAPTNFVLRAVDVDTNFTTSAMVGTNLVVNGVTNGTSAVQLFAGTNLLATIDVTVIRISVPTNELVIAQDQRVSYPVSVIPDSVRPLLRFVPADTNTASSFYTNNMVHVVGRLDGDTMIVPMVGTNALCAIRNLAVTNCACRCLPGETTFDFSEGLHLRMNLGLRAGGRTAGHLRFDLHDATFTNRALRYSHERSGLGMAFDTHGVIAQVQAPQGTADVTFATNGNQVRVDFGGTTAPFASVTITGSGGVIEVTETRDGNVIRQTSAAYDSGTGNWTYTQPLRTVEVQNAGTTILVKEPNGTVVSRRQLTRPVHAWSRETTVETVGAGASARTTTYTYDPATARLTSITRPDGSVESRSYDTSGRLTQLTQPFGNANGARVTTYSYTPLAAGDNGTIKPDEPRRTFESLHGVVISHRSLSYTPTQAVETVTLPGGLARTTITDYDTTNGGPAEVVWRVRPPGGITEIYTYPWGVGAGLEVVERGTADAGGITITNGTSTATVTGFFGELLSVTVSDIASGTVLSSESYGGWDAFNRPGSISTLSGTRYFTYGCCTLDSETEPDGTVVSYAYDALQRRIATTRNGITTLQGYDAAGNVTSVTRLGTDNTSVTVNRSTYDLGGRRTSEQDALNHLTTIVETATTRTITHPDGGTRMETRALDGSLLSVSGSATHPVTYVHGVLSSALGGIPAGTRYTTEQRAASPGGAALETVTTYADVLGHTRGVHYSDNTSVSFTYDSVGRLTSRTARDGVVTLYTYNALGELEDTILDLNRDGVADYAGTDRITRVANDVSGGLRRTRTYVWETPNQNVAKLVNVQTASPDGNSVSTTVGLAADGTGGITSSTVTTFGGNGARTVTTTAPDGSSHVEEYQSGLLVTATRRDANSTQLSQTTYGYDAHGRMSSVTDARTGTTTQSYDAADRLITIVSPAPVAGQAPLTTLRFLDAMGRLTRTQHPDGTSVTNLYSPSGELLRTYPSAFTYDAQGRVTTMKTWRNFASDTGAAITTWNYDPQNGFLLSKQHPDGQGPSYTYASGGRPATRTWARGLTTTYTYNNAGDLASVSYDDGQTPGVTHTYDRRGRRIGTTGSTFTYSPAAQLASESYSGGVLDGLTITNAYDALLRRSSLTLQPFNDSTLYSYDPASRLGSVSDGTNTATYTYLANSPLVDQIAFTQSGQPRLTTTNQYDLANRLTWVASTPSTQTPDPISFAYNYNAANQRTLVTHADNSYWSYQYDTLGQVTSGKHFWADGTPVAGQQFEYAFDDIGNRQTAAHGGNAGGSSLRVETYTASSLNQYTQRTIPGFGEIQGRARSDATVTVNLQATERQGAFWRYEQAANNSTGAVQQTLGIIAVLNGAGPGGIDVIASNTSSLFLPQTPETFTHDADGNLTRDGRWNYSWDGESRLTTFASLTNLPTAMRRKLECTYDPHSRRTQKIASTWNGYAYLPQATNRFVYDGWNLVAQLDGNNQLEKSFTWGTDLSGTMQGAGGVGGLRSMTLHQGPYAGTYFYCYDGNGNVAALVSASTGEEMARYDYSTFGELLRATGPLAFLNPFRFSTKFCDDETGLYYYGYRFYDPSTGRWLSRDPIEEHGGLNLYQFIGNDPLDYVDPFGLDWGDWWDGRTWFNSAFWVGLWEGWLEDQRALNDFGTAPDGTPMLGGVPPLPGGGALAKLIKSEATCLATKGGFAVASKAIPRQITILGSRTDSLAAKRWPGHNVLDIQKWTAKQNIRWLDGAVRRGDEIYLATDPVKHRALLDSLPNRPFSAFLDLELPFLQSKGYIQQGLRMVPGP